MSEPAGLRAEARAVGEALRRRGLTVAAGESCTGGLLGAVLTSVPGSSAYVRGGVVAYANDVKTSLLRVPAPLIAARGAVSAEVAEAMAEGARAVLGADLGVGITGVAGPEPDGARKPAGLVFVSVAGAGERVRTVRLNDDRGRDGNRAAAVEAALRLLVEAAWEDSVADPPHGDRPR